MRTFDASDVSETNQRPRDVLATAGMTQAVLAERIGVDTKSVERWITQDRVPHPTTRAKGDAKLHYEETCFWPALLGSVQSRNASEAEQIQMWPTRNEVPGDVWRTLLGQTQQQPDVLVYAGSFLFEAHDFVDTVRAKAAAGPGIRILVGDTRSKAILTRSREEGRPAIADRCRSSIEYSSVLANESGVQIRTHGTTLYASLFRFDESMLISHHTYGSFASHSPMTHLQKFPGGQLCDSYANSFDRVWPTGESVT